MTALRGNYDVLIVGDGIIGTARACFLKQQGPALERAPIDRKEQGHLVIVQGAAAARVLHDRSDPAGLRQGNEERALCRERHSLTGGNGLAPEAIIHADTRIQAQETI